MLSGKSSQAVAEQHPVSLWWLLHWLCSSFIWEPLKSILYLRENIFNASPDKKSYAWPQYWTTRKSSTEYFHWMWIACTVIHIILFISPTNFNVNNYFSSLSTLSKPEPTGYKASPAYVIKVVLLSSLDQKSLICHPSARTGKKKCFHIVPHDHTPTVTLPPVRANLSPLVQTC